MFLTCRQKESRFLKMQGLKEIIGELILLTCHYITMATLNYAFEMQEKVKLKIFHVKALINK